MIETPPVERDAKEPHPNGIVAPAFAIATQPDHEVAPRLARRGGALRLTEITYAKGAALTGFAQGVWGQSVDNGAVVGAPFMISDASGTREITPSIACTSVTSCVAPYRWFNPSDTTTDADRIKARILSY